MAMLVNDRSHVDPNNVPLASLVSQEEHVDVNFIRNNNFNNTAYRNNFASNNYRSYPSNSDNGYLGIPIRDFYFCALRSLVVLSFPQLLSFSSVFPKPLSETLRRSSDGRIPV
jgi:hypothetical protein